MKVFTTACSSQTSLFCLLIGFLLAFGSCQKKNDAIQHSPNGFTDSAKAWLEQSGKISLLNADLLWEQASIVKRSNDKRYLEVPILEKVPIRARVHQNGNFRFVEKVDSLRSYSSLVLYTDNGGNFKCHLMKVVEDAATPSGSAKVSLASIPSGFKGMIYYTNLKGAIVEGYQYNDGKISHKVSNPKRKIADNARLECITLTIDYYQQVCYNGRCFDWQYTHSTSTTTCTYVPEPHGPSDQPYDPDAPPDCYECGGTTYTEEEQQVYDAAIEIDTVIREISNPCLNGIFTKVTEDKLKSELAKLFRQTYVAGGGNYTLTIKDADQVLDNEGYSIAGRSKPVNGNLGWEIILSREWAATASNEFMAMVVLHELLHSYLFFYQNNNSVPLSEFESHKIMIEQWVLQFRDALVEIYGIPQVNAVSLALEGVEDVLLLRVDTEAKKNIWRAGYDEMARTKFKVSLDNATYIANGYIQGTVGTKCP